MGIWATASLFIAGLLWLEVESNPQLFQNHQQPSGSSQIQPRPPRQPQAEFFYRPKGKPEAVAQSQAHSALGLQPQRRLRLTQIDFPPGNDQNDPIGAATLYNNFERNLEQIQPLAFPIQETNERQLYDVKDLSNTSGYDDYKTSQTTHLLGPHQIETIDSEHFHKEVPAFDISHFQHHESEKHGEVHYHQHKHVHKHEHKQEHVHQHKQAHQHKHLHHQQHKHDHLSEHGHQHKHNHHQEHKHHHGHQHKHDNYHDHKHNHGHKLHHGREYKPGHNYYHHSKYY